MPSFGNTSKQRIYTCHPYIQAIALEVIKIIDITVLCGYRTKERQNHFFAKGLSKVQWPLSYHNKYPSQAIDLAPYEKKPPHIDWKDKPAFAYMAGVVLACSHYVSRQHPKFKDYIMVWGGNWDLDDQIIKDQDFDDLPHFKMMKRIGENVIPID